MTEELKNECTALILYEKGELLPLFGVPSALYTRPPESFVERKRRELREAFGRGEVADPISILVSIGISAALYTASYALQSAFAPKPKPIEKGRTTGDMVINAELGILLNEIYFGDPGDGYGGSWVAPVIYWTDGIRKEVNVTRQPVGGGKGGGGGQTQEVREILYKMNLGLMWTSNGPHTLLREKANSDVIYDLYGEVSIYQGEAASSYTAPTVVVAYESASGGYEITLQANGTTSGGAVQWNTLKSNGAATRHLTIRFRANPGVAQPIKHSLNGAPPVSLTLPPGTGDFQSHTISVALNDGLNTFKIQNASPTLNIGVDNIYCFPGHTAATQPTGVFEPGAGADPTYDPLLPPDPQDEYTLPTERYRGTPLVDEYGVRTATLLHGGGAQIAIYPGNDTQQPDPTEQAAVDAQFGEGSTPAYRGRCREVNTNLYLTRWSNALPNRTGLLEHAVIRTLAQFYAHQCGRVNIASADYDFTAVASVKPRGLRITGRRFEAREPMTATERPYRVFFCEEDFQLKAKPRTETAVATLTDKDFGWREADSESEEIPGLVSVTEPNPVDQPRRTDVKYVSLDRDGEPGLQSYARQLTEGEESRTLDLDFTFTDEEAQALAQGEEYREYVEKPVLFWLSWEHLWIVAGDVIIAELSDGFTYLIQITKIKGGIGVQNCEGILLDEPIYTQPVVTDPNGFENPIVPIPAMTLLFLMDIPLLRDKDAEVNRGSGFYAAVTPRTNSAQAWTGATLYFDNVGWEQLATFTLPATMGRAVTALNSVTSASVDNVNTVTVDLYGTTQLLESASDADLENGANAAMIGGEVVQFKSATRVDGYPNRWILSGFLRARANTESGLSTHVVNERFVLLNEAVQFVPFNLNHKGRQFDFKAASVGQSLDDAATVHFTWTGKTLLIPAVSNLRVAKANFFVWHAFWNRVSRVGLGMRSGAGMPLGEEEEIYQVEVYNGASLGRGPLRLKEKPVHPVGWIVPYIERTSSNWLVPDRDGSLFTGSSSGLRGIIESVQTFTGDFFFETTIGSSGNWLFKTGITSAHASFYAGQAFNPSFYLRGLSATSVTAEGLQTITVAPGDRLAIRGRGAVVEYFKNYQGEMSAPFYRSLKGYDSTTPQKIVMEKPTDSNSYAIISPRIIDPIASFRYSDEDAIQDFGIVPSVITLRVYQESATAGRGPYREITIT
ncbi:MAG TPA: phage tail protein [Pyrinomonadaceae bacterium]|jgi:hypothetical protein